MMRPTIPVPSAQHKLLLLTHRSSFTFNSVKDQNINSLFLRESDFSREQALWLCDADDRPGRAYMIQPVSTQSDCLACSTLLSLSSTDECISFWRIAM